MKIHVLGTGSAMVTKCYNTCFTIENNGEHFLVDGGGGNGIFNQLGKASIALKDIKNIFISHAHTDHILGVLWVVRALAQEIWHGIISHQINIYASESVQKVLKTLCEMMLNKGLFPYLEKLNFITIDEDKIYEISGMKVNFFNTQAKGDTQHGFILNENLLVFAGDKPLVESNYDLARNCTWLLHESFSLDCNREVAHKKFHSTAKDAAEIAAAVGTKNLILWHTEDRDLINRQTKYTDEAKQFFNGTTLVPNDLDVIVL